MKSFLKYTLATITGVVISSFVLFFLFIGIVGALVSSSEKPFEPKPNSILHIKLNQEIKDRGSENPMENFDFTTFKALKKLGLKDILNNIEKAKNDANIKGIYLDLVYVATGYASTEEIRDALLKFKESGKFIIAYSEIYSQKAYYLSTVADSIFINPIGLIDFTGLSRRVLFYKGTFDKLGIEPQIIRHGEYKSYVEPFMLKKMSEKNKKQTMEYMGDLWNHILKGISVKRKISIDQLNEMATDLTAVFDPEKSLKLNFIDGLRYEDEVLKTLKNLSGIDQDKNLQFVSLGKYDGVPNKRIGKGLAKNKIAVIYAEGDINIGEGDNNTLGSDKFSKVLRSARKDSSIKAVVLRVNSPGGSMLASEIIRREVDLLSQAKPVVASMGNVAASGGYYILCNADTIIASPNTITGSIGVFAILYNAKPFFDNKIGITSDVVKTNEKADLGTFFRPLTSAEKSILLKYVEKAYDDFTDLVSKGRNMTKEEVDKIGRGLVWSGEDALKNGLIDGFGGLKKAIEIASEMAKLDNYRIIELPKQEEPLEIILKDLTGDAKTKLLKAELGDDYKYYKEFKNLINFQGVQARIPFELIDE